MVASVWVNIGAANGLLPGDQTFAWTNIDFS